MTDALTLAGMVVLLAGLVFCLISSVGLVRFPDLYTRLHAATKTLTFGAAGILLGAALILGGELLWTKSVAAIAFLFLTAPVSGHMLARTALRKGIEPVTGPPQKNDSRCAARSSSSCKDSIAAASIGRFTTSPKDPVSS